MNVRALFYLFSGSAYHREPLLASVAEIRSVWDE